MLRLLSPPNTLTHGSFRNYSRGQGYRAYFRLPVEGLHIPFRDSDSGRGKGKGRASHLLSLSPVFERAIKRLPENIRQDNDEVFDNWYTLLSSVDTYGFWREDMKGFLKLRLQNAPGNNAMNVYNNAFESFSKSIIQLIQYMPSPSDFAKPGRWGPIQKKDPPVLCFRPAPATGLPLCTLHDVFHQFQCETSVLLPNHLATAEAVAARIAASRLCLEMAGEFQKEDERGEAFDSCVTDLLGEMEKQRILGPKPATHYGRVDRCIKERGIVIAICEDKAETGCGGGDVYMQIAADYHFLVRVLAGRVETDTEVDNFLGNGAPCFLICIMGHMLYICGGFYDGYKPVVEPLSKAVFMISDLTHTRNVEVATLLWALVRGITSLRQLVSQPPEPPKIPFAPCTPRIYGTCELIGKPKDETGTLTFKSRLYEAGQQLLLATLNSSSYSNQLVVVKLVSRSYSQQVHEHLATKGLAPKLYGYAKVDGAPTAYVMEYLDPSEWETLHRFMNASSTVLSRTELRKALEDIVRALKSKNYVHGDLRPNNIMIRKDLSKQSLGLMVVDYDWAGEASKVYYPAERNPEIKGIKWPGEAGGKIENGHDWKLILSWL